jgi:hypothetical protein
MSLGFGFNGVVSRANHEPWRSSADDGISREPYRNRRFHLQIALATPK